MTTSRPQAAVTRTSRSIALKIARRRTITAHISPYANGMAPETFDWVAALNAEAERHGIGVKFTGLANKIEATGDIQGAANDHTTLCGWFLRRAIEAGYLGGEDEVMRTCNPEWRKELRKRAKTKAGMAEEAAIAKEAAREKEFISKVANGASKLHELVKAVPQAELDRMKIDPNQFRMVRIPPPLRTNWPKKPFERPPTRRDATKTTFRKGGPNPRRRNPDS
jgi:hypothetical protein